MAKKNQKLFKKGDKVIHPYHGGGTVIDIIKKPQEKGKVVEYYLINISSDSLNLYIPVDSVEKVQIRKIESKKILDECLSMMQKNAFRLISNPTPLENKVRAKINAGNLISLTEAIGFIWRFKTKKEKEGKINPLNKNLSELLNHAKKLFIGQFALIKNIEYSAAEQYFNKFINKHYKHFL